MRIHGHDLTVCSVRFTTVARNLEPIQEQAMTEQEFEERITTEKTWSRERWIHHFSVLATNRAPGFDYAVAHARF